MCYSFSRQDPEPDVNGTYHNLWLPFSESDSYCKSHNAKSLVVNSDHEQAWITPRLYGLSWLNMKIKSAGNIPQTWEDGSPIIYGNWRTVSIGNW